jgi:pyruvate/2-oxoglutarate dehydrogenase complex dihydrolipoamide acyltransferase (E2) component
MPALEMAQDSGKLVSWLKQEGESVRKGEMLLEVETDKAVVEVEAAADGILAGVTAKPGTWCTSATRSRGSCSRVKQPHRGGRHAARP